MFNFSYTPGFNGRSKSSFTGNASIGSCCGISSWGIRQGHSAPQVVEVFALEIPSFPLIPTSIELPGFTGPLVPVMGVVRSNRENGVSVVDAVVAHGPILNVGPEQLPEPPVGYVDTGRAGIVGIDQHDLSGDEEHADFPEYPDGDEHNDQIFPDPRFASHIVFPRSFGHPTSDWLPKNR